MNIVVIEGLNLLSRSWPITEGGRMKSNWDKPSISLLSKLGSALVHADEYLGSDGHNFDLLEFRDLLKDAEVQTWLIQGTKSGLLPIKRTR